MPFFGLRAGGKSGVFSTWQECEKNSKGIRDSEVKRFATYAEAEMFVNGGGGDASKGAPTNQGQGLLGDEPGSGMVRPSGGMSSGMISGGLLKAPRFASVKDVIELVRVRARAVDKHGYFSNQAGVVVCYVDAKIAGDKGGIGVFFGPSHQMNIAERITKSPTQLQVMIVAVAAAVTALKTSGCRAVEIRVKDEFVTNILVKYLPKWKENGFKSPESDDRRPTYVANKEELELLVKAAEGVHVVYKHVPPELGDTGTAAAGQLAKEAAEKW